MNAEIAPPRQSCSLTIRESEAECPALELPMTRGIFIAILKCSELECAPRFV